MPENHAGTEGESPPLKTRIVVAAVLGLFALGLLAVVAPVPRADSGNSGGIWVPRLPPTKTPSPVASPTPRPAPTPVPRAAPADGPGIFKFDCVGSGPNSVRVTFLWTPSGGGRQWVDLSIFGNNFAPGTFIGAGPFQPRSWGFIWSGLLQGTTHYARVNTLTSQGWMPSRTLQFYTPVCDRTAYNIVERPPAADMVHLQQNIAAAVARESFSTAVAITDLQTGETIHVNGHTPRLPGCTINLFALMAVVIDLQHGRYSEPRPGDLIGQTINRSDPVTARTLMAHWLGGGDVYTGVRRTNDLMRSLGMNNTLMDHPPAYLHETLYGLPNVTTALDANRGLRAIWDGRVLTPGWRDYLLHKMTLVKPGLNYLIPAGTGPGARSSHKNGFLFAEGWADNDIGIVWFERGGQRFGYAISFFTQHVPRQYADIPLGQQVSRLAWQWFTARYGHP
jgi:hypothetical protein